MPVQNKPQNATQKHIQLPLALKMHVHGVVGVGMIASSAPRGTLSAVCVKKRVTSGRCAVLPNSAPTMSTSSRKSTCHTSATSGRKRLRTTMNTGPPVWRSTVTARASLDTGAAVSVVSDREPWLASADLQSSNKILRGPGASHIAVIRVMDATHLQRKIVQRAHLRDPKSRVLLTQSACMCWSGDDRARRQRRRGGSRVRLSCRTSVALQRDWQIENGASHHATSEFDTGLSVHGEENCASSASTNQVGASVDGSSGDYLSSNCADAMVLRHGSSSEGKWVGSDLCRPHATE